MDGGGVAQQSQSQLEPSLFWTFFFLILFFFLNLSSLVKPLRLCMFKNHTGNDASLKKQQNKHVAGREKKKGKTKGYHRK